MAVKKLRESFAASPLAGARVDKAAGIVFGVLVCGTESANGRRYPWGRGLTCNPRVYEGRPVNCDHGRESTVERRLGWLKNVRVGSDGRPRADLHLLKSHPMAGRVLEAAERNPSLFGLSHVASCRTRYDRGTEIVEDVQSVESVDLVSNPATVKSLFESRQRPAATRPPTAADIVALFKGTAARPPAPAALRRVTREALTGRPTPPRPGGGLTVKQVVQLFTGRG